MTREDIDSHNLMQFFYRPVHRNFLKPIRPMKLDTRNIRDLLKTAYARAQYPEFSKYLNKFPITPDKNILKSIEVLY